MFWNCYAEGEVATMRSHLLISWLARFQVRGRAGKAHHRRSPNNHLGFSGKVSGHLYALLASCAACSGAWSACFGSKSGEISSGGESWSVLAGILRFLAFFCKCSRHVPYVARSIAMQFEGNINSFAVFWVKACFREVHWDHWSIVQDAINSFLYA
jgi:hypothetical protein